MNEEEVRDKTQRKITKLNEVEYLQEIEINHGSNKFIHVCACIRESICINRSQDASFNLTYFLNDKKTQKIDKKSQHNKNNNNCNNNEIN